MHLSGPGVRWTGVPPGMPGMTWFCTDERRPLGGESNRSGASLRGVEARDAPMCAGAPEACECPRGVE